MVSDLISFHTDHKLLILAHSPKHYTRLGMLVAEARKREWQSLLNEYFTVLKDGLKLLATNKKRRVCWSILPDISKSGSLQKEKQELMDVIHRYHKGMVPLIVPPVSITLYVNKYDEPYLKRQYYLHLHPAELMLRNHV